MALLNRMYFNAVFGALGGLLGWMLFGVLGDPNPGDATYTAFNREAYRSGDVLPNSGHLRVTVRPDDVKVDYVRAVLPGEEKRAGTENGQVGFSYTVKPRNGGAK